MSQYNIIAESQEYTVVSEYEKAVSTSDAYQSEADLERGFIHLLGEQGYDYLPIHAEADLISNLRTQLEKLNNYHFTDNEWEQFFNTCIANKNDDIVAKTTKIQEDYIHVLKRDTGGSQNIYLLDKKNIHNNTLQVINQYEEKEGNHDTRYDVSILVNGLPLVHVELKRRGVQLKEAFNQINRYQRDSFWADSNNKVITDLLDFTKTFFSKHTLLNILTKYCVFTSERMLMVMRPYQIAATERIIQRINVANNYKHYGSIQGGGYIWHTTGSGKTLTSFKTAQLASRLPYIDKVLFVVDRKDLDYQTMKEYNRFEEGAAGNVGYADVDWWAADGCEYIIGNADLTNRYIYHYLMTKKDYLLCQVRKASIPRLSPSVIKDLEIPVPSRAEQQRIIDILDRFDTLTNDLTAGLPAEIEKRTQQYEYYRDKLLTFKRINA